MKKITEIKNEKAVFFACVNGLNEFESYSLAECKKFLCDYLKSLKENGIKIENTEDFYIGMYSITIE